MAAHDTDQNPRPPQPADADLRRTPPAAANACELADTANRAAADGEVAGLRVALETRATIGIAQGLVMAQHKLSAEAAFAFLVQLSQHSNVKLRDVAAQMVADYTGEAP